MNRKKKINEKLKAFQKRKNSKLHKSNKPKYISKAERAKIAEEEANAAEKTADQTSDDSKPQSKPKAE